MLIKTTCAATRATDEQYAQGVRLCLPERTAKSESRVQNTEGNTRDGTNRRRWSAWHPRGVRRHARSFPAERQYPPAGLLPADDDPRQAVCNAYCNREGANYGVGQVVLFNHGHLSWLSRPASSRVQNMLGHCFSCARWSNDDAYVCLSRCLRVL